MFLGRRILAAAVMAAAVLVGGCSLEPSHGVPHDAAEGGQTFAEMEAAVEAIPGINVVEIAGGGPPNIKGNTGYQFSLELEPGWEVVDGVALVDFLMASAWSVREGYLPNAQVSISLNSGDGYDIRAAAADGGWVGVREENMREYSIAHISLWEGEPQGLANRERLGEWPGDVPEAPVGVMARKS